MEQRALADVDHSPHPRSVASVRRLLGAELGTDHLDVTHFELDPGDQFSGAYHRHLEREEVFVILAGTATFRTEDGTRIVTAGETIYFAPSDWQLGRNESDATVEALLVGTPTELAPVEAYLDCPDCGEETRFRVEPAEQESGEPMAEHRVCTRCETVFEL